MTRLSAGRSCSNLSRCVRFLSQNVHSGCGARTASFEVYPGSFLGLSAQGVKLTIYLHLASRMSGTVSLLFPVCHHVVDRDSFAIFYLLCFKLLEISWLVLLLHVCEVLLLIPGLDTGCHDSGFLRFSSFPAGE